MKYSYSEDFLNELDVSNIDIANKLLTIFNDAFLGFENSELNENQLYIRMCHYDKDGVKLGKSTLFVIEPNLVQFYETGTLEINELKSLVSRIIINCDLSYSERNNFENELRIMVEKYALTDFIKVVTKDYINQNSTVIENINYQIVADPQNAQIYINGELVESVNGVYNGTAKAGSEIVVRVEAQGYQIEQESFILNSEIQKVYNLVPIYTKFHLAIEPSDAEINLYKIKESIDSNGSNDQNLEEISLIKKDDMYCADLKLYDQFILYAKKRMYKPHTYSFTNLDNIYKVINLESYKVHVTINLDENYPDAFVSINGKSVDVFPYQMDCAIGEFLTIKAHTGDGLKYSNFVVINEADIADGLTFNITFTKTYMVTLSTTNENALMCVNSELIGNQYRGEFIENSVVDVRVELEGYVPINEKILVRENVNKVYILNELIPRLPVTVSVFPEDAFLSINGIHVMNPHIFEVYENSVLSIRAMKSGYYPYTEKVVVNQPIIKNISLIELPVQNAVLNISCNVEEATCYVNDHIFDIPGSLTVAVGTKLKIEVFKDGYNTYQNEIVVNESQDLIINLEPLINPNTVILTLNVNRSNALVMVNSRQIDPIEGSNDVYELSVPINTMVDILVTLQGYSPYREKFICTENTTKNIIMEKDPELEMHKLQVYVQNPGATLLINGIVEASPFVREYRQRTPINIKCHLEGFRPFEQNIVMTEDIIVPIVLEKLINVKPIM